MTLTADSYAEVLDDMGYDPNSLRVFIDDIETARGCLAASDDEGWADVIALGDRGEILTDETGGVKSIRVYGVVRFEMERVW